GSVVRSCAYRECCRTRQGVVVDRPIPVVVGPQRETAVQEPIILERRVLDDPTVARLPEVPVRLPARVRWRVVGEEVHAVEEVGSQSPSRKLHFPGRWTLQIVGSALRDE